MLRSTLSGGHFRMLVSPLSAFCSEMGLGKTLNRDIHTEETKKKTKNQQINKVGFSPFSVDFFYLLQRNTTSFSSVSEYFSDGSITLLFYPHLAEFIYLCGMIFCFHFLCPAYQIYFLSSSILSSIAKCHHRSHMSVYI